MGPETFSTCFLLSSYFKFLQPKTNPISYLSQIYRLQFELILITFPRIKRRIMGGLKRVSDLAMATNFCQGRTILPKDERCTIRPK